MLKKIVVRKNTADQTYYQFFNHLNKRKYKKLKKNNAKPNYL